MLSELVPHRAELTCARPRSLKVGGVVPFTATDYPGHLSVVIFVQGCPWRCGYCHNPHLQKRTRTSTVPWDNVLRFLQRRVGLIDAVVFSGGEPTADPALPDAIDDIRKLGFKVGLHSAGTHPQRFRDILPLVDWIGLDIKASFEKYAHITGMRGSGKHARSCLEALLASGVQYECRTTLHPDLLSEAELLRLARTLAGMNVKNYALQRFRTQGCVDSELNAAPTTDYPGDRLVTQISALFPELTVRRG